MEGTFWALVPTLTAVGAALVTKEVYISLLAGILTGAVIAAHDPIEALGLIFDTMAQKTSASEGGLGNMGIIIFIVELGVLVSLMNGSGGTQALSYRLSRRIKSKRGAMLAAAGLGCTIFIDDYFNRLAVGTVMKPVFDKNGLSRIKLAQIVCGVSVSICILVPISSWASAIVAGIGEGMDGAFSAYLKTLACNFYPIFTLAFLIIMPFFEPNGKVGENVGHVDEVIETKPDGKAIDLILPIVVLIASNLLLMKSYESETALAISGAIAVLFCFAIYLPRKVLSLRQMGRDVASGFKSTADVVMILVFAWTLTGISEKLGIGAFIGGLTSSMSGAEKLLPAIMFVASMGTAFATGTAWGTFGLLVPLAVPMFEPFSTLQILTISAVLSGSVFGNQVSPISDSTLLASKICECDHIEFIRSQFPTCLVVASISFVGFFTAGLSGCIWAGNLASIAAFAIVPLFLIRKKGLKRKIKSEKYQI